MLRADRKGAGEAVIVLAVIGAVLGVAGLVYLMIALVDPDRF